HPLSIPNDTAWGSDEAIVLAENGGTVAAKGNGPNDSMADSTQTKTGARATVRAGDGHGKYSKRAHDRPPPGENGKITVTQEYSVQSLQNEDAEGPRNHTPFAFLRK
ncbi:MAG: hypothetical protein M1830_006802, partial [Pleopsidium flavum]